MKITIYRRSRVLGEGVQVYLKFRTEEGTEVSQRRLYVSRILKQHIYNKQLGTDWRMELRLSSTVEEKRGEGVGKQSTNFTQGEKGKG